MRRRRVRKQKNETVVRADLTRRSAGASEEDSARGDLAAERTEEEARGDKRSEIERVCV